MHLILQLVQSDRLWKPQFEKNNAIIALLTKNDKLSNIVFIIIGKTYWAEDLWSKQTNCFKFGYLDQSTNKEMYVIQSCHDA